MTDHSKPDPGQQAGPFAGVRILDLRGCIAGPYYGCTLPAVNATSLRLHGIASRTVGAHIASEVLRLNDAVRAGAASRISYGAQPADFAALLLASADPANAQEAT